MRKTICLLPGMVLYLICVAGCHLTSLNAAQRDAAGLSQHFAANSPRPILVEVHQVKAPAGTASETIPALISVESESVVLAQRDGILMQVDVPEGARVTKGQIIAQLNDETVRLQLRQAELEAARLKVEELQYEALVKVSQTELERVRALDRDGLASQADIERQSYKLEVSRQELEKTRLSSRAAQARVEVARLDLEKTMVRAPINGIITHRYARTGSGVVSNERLFEIAQLSPLVVRFRLSQTRQSSLAPGSLISLSLAGSDRIITRARIRRADPTIEAVSNSLGYLADVPVSARLLPGAAVNVHLSLSVAAGSVLVPRAVFPVATTLQRGAVVTLFVLDGERARTRTVTLGELSDEQVEVTSGLSSGELVLLAPSAELQDGETVEPVKG